LAPSNQKFCIRPWLWHPVDNIWAVMVVWREDYQKCSVLYCVPQLCTVIRHTHMSSSYRWSRAGWFRLCVFYSWLRICSLDWCEFSYQYHCRSLDDYLERLVSTLDATQSHEYCGCDKSSYSCHRRTLCLVHTADTDKTRLSRLVAVSGVNWVGDSRRQFSVYWRQQFCPVSSVVWTHLWTGLDLSPIQFTPRTPTKQDKTVL